MIFAEMFAPVWSTCRMAVHRNRRLIADGEENERERSTEHRETVIRTAQDYITDYAQISQSTSAAVAVVSIVNGAPTLSHPLNFIG